MWHCAVAVNAWRGRISGAIDQKCPVCPTGSQESVLRRFWECSSDRVAWVWGIHILNALVEGKEARGP